MDLQPSEQQELLRQSVDRFLAKELPSERRRGQGLPADFLAFWRRAEAALGLSAAGLPEHVGGLGGGGEAETIVAGALGRALAVTPYIDCAVLSASLLTNLGEHGLVRRILAGELLAVAATEEPQTRGDALAVECRADPAPGGWRISGTKVVVNFAAEADLVLLPARVADGDFALFALAREQLTGSLRPYRVIDETPAADLVLDRLETPERTLIARGPAAAEAFGRAVDRATAALCGEAAAIGQVLLDDTVAYAKEREQFGAPLASFQALQHRMVDMFLAVQQLSAAALLAALKADRPDAVSAAKATVSLALRQVGQEAVQLHGAMGLTEELRAGRYFKRATVIESRLGGADHHVARYARTRARARAA